MVPLPGSSRTGDRLVAWARRLLFASWPSPPRLEALGEVGGAEVRVHPHDPTAHTQGLLWVSGALYESTGLHGHSSLRRVDLESGRVLRITRLRERDFAEGIASVGDRIVQVTWRSQTALVYDRETLEPLQRVAVPGEAWGLASDGERLILSDGTARLRFLDPTNFADAGSLEVREHGRPIAGLNDLDVIAGGLVANVHPGDRLAMISMAGEIVDWIDLAPMRARPGLRGRDQLANGVAWDAAGARLLVTGKRWPALFEIRLPGLACRAAPRRSLPV